MSMQISVDPAGLTQAQREAVAGFILAYPSGIQAGKLNFEVQVDTKEAKTALAEIHEYAEPSAAIDPIADLAKDGGEFDASLAFALDPVAAAFGGERHPLPPGAIAAPSIAGVAPLSIAPAAMQATTSTATLNGPVPPAPNSAPVAVIAAPQTGNPAGGVDLDKRGLPWDGRIHAGTKRKNADGSWTNKRGVDPALIAQVEAELRQLMGAPAPLVTSAPILAPQVANVTTPTAGPVYSGAPAPAPLAVNVAPLPPAQSTVPGSIPQDARAIFVGLVGRASAAIQSGKITQAEVNQVCAASGVAALPLLANRLDLVPQVAGQVDALIASRP